MTDNPFRVLWARGFRNLIPIIPKGAPISERSNIARRIASGKSDPRGKVPGVKGPNGWLGIDWLSHHTIEPDLDRWFAMGAGVGIKTGPQPGGGHLVAIDIDTLDMTIAKLIERAALTHFGTLPCRIGQPPKRLLLARCDEPISYMRVDFGQGPNGLPERVELLSAGRQFVAAGIHPGTGKPYRWTVPLRDYDALPVVTAASLVAFLEELRGVLPAAQPIVREGGAADVDQNTLRGSPATVAAAVRALPNTTALFPTRESYLAVGYAIKAALGAGEAGSAADREGLALFQDWCARWPGENGEGNDPDVVEADWRRMKPPFRRGAGWLYEMAERLGGGDGSDGGLPSFSRASVWLEPVEEIGEALFPENRDNGAGAAGGGGASKVRRLERTTLEAAGAGALDGGAEPLIEGLLDQSAMSVMYAESNAGKTFVAMSAGHAIARGASWGGMACARLGVLYVATEGAAGMRKRAAALVARSGSAEGRFQLILTSVDLLRPDADWKAIVEAVREMAAEIGLAVGLVVIDTLFRALAGGDENSGQDMGALVKNLDRIRAATGAHLMVVHHSGKDKARGSRGHSSLRAATDTEIEIADGVIEVKKQRDLENGWSSRFVLDEVEIGTDAKGRKVTSAVMRLVGKTEAATAALGVATVKEQEVVDAIEALDGLDPDEKPGVALADLVSHLEAKMARDSVKFHLQSLLAKNLVGRSGRSRYSLKRGTLTLLDSQVVRGEKEGKVRKSGGNAFH